MEMFEIPLDIPGVKIEKVSITKEGSFLVTVSSTVIGTRCHKCDRHICKPYGYGREITLRHLPILGKKVFIVIRPPRYICEYCDDHTTTTQQTGWYNWKSIHTKKYEEHLLLSLVNSTVSDVSIKEDVGYESVMGAIDRYISHDVDWKNIRNIDLIGIDEISLKKGHKDFVTIVTGRADSKITILAVLKDRTKEVVKKFLLSIPSRIRKQIKEVCTDMYDGFVNAAKEVFGKKTMITIDRFHIAKHYRKSLDQARKKEMKRLKSELPEEEYKKYKGIIWILRKQEMDLTDEDLKLLKDLFEKAPTLGIVYSICNELTSLFNSDMSKTKSKNAINRWITKAKDSGLGYFDKFISTLGNWMDEVTNYFVNRNTSGFVEGFNNKIKVIKRRCYGILNPKHLFQRIFLDVEGYHLFA